MKRFILVMLLYSCSSLQKNENNKQIIQYNNNKVTVENSNNVKNNDNNSVYFFVFRIRKDVAQAQNKIDFVSKMKNTGKLKPVYNATIEYENSLIIDVYEQNKCVCSTTIEHPLYKKVEYPDDNNTLTSKQLELTNEEFFVRLQINATPDKIIVYEKLKNDIKKKLTSFNL